MVKDIVIIGGGGHACVLLDAMEESYMHVKGYVSLEKSTNFDIPYLGDDSYLDNQELRGSVLLVNGLGSIHVPYKRKGIFLRYKKMGYKFYTIIHPKAVVAKNVIIGEGAQIMAGCIVQTGCIVNNNTILNTNVSIDHHCFIGEHSHIAPGSTLCGDVVIGNTSHIGPNSTIIQGLSLPNEIFIPAHSLLKDSYV